jgi:Uma2 family endonuclease
VNTKSATLSLVVAHASPFVAPRVAPDARVVVNGVPWSTYVTMRDLLDDAGSGVRLTYLEGTLEIMSPSNDHESLKKLLARLLEAWADEAGVDLEGLGSTTFRREAAERGLEPDECYCVGDVRELPDFAIEVVVSSGLLDKLEVYAGLGIPEVWVSKDETLSVYRLVAGQYRTQTTSECVPSLDLAHLASFVRIGVKQSAAVRAYRAELRARTCR